MRVVKLVFVQKKNCEGIKSVVPVEGGGDLEGHLEMTNGIFPLALRLVMVFAGQKFSAVLKMWLLL